MTARFHIHYNTHWGEQLFIIGSIPGMGNWEEMNAAPMVSRGNGHWEFEMQIGVQTSLEYKYFIHHKDGNHEWEFGENRELTLTNNLKINDCWRSNHHSQNVFYTSPFKKSFFVRKPSSKTPVTRGAGVVLQIRAPQVNSNQQLCVLGNIQALGEWDDSKALLLSDSKYPVWTVDLKIPEEVTEIAYKYGLYDSMTKKLIGYESGSTRHLTLDHESKLLLNDEYFDHPQGNWKGAGVALPVFSLKTNRSFGVGEFLDLVPMVDWAKKTGLKLIQLLPVNDTIATHSWVDSYPYAPVSVIALHPIYANLKDLGDLADKKDQARFDKLRTKLNELEMVDYEAVLNAKSEFFKLKFEEDKLEFLKGKKFKNFFTKNKKWLIPYAVFSCLRDLNGTPDFSKWSNYSTINQKELAMLSDPESKEFEDVAIHFYIQFHLDKQLGEATSYARKNGVVLKGDIPIGTYRHSVDAWIAPELYNMKGQSGAPPDAFSSSGQNWGFPTYNWEEMAKDGYSWWKERLSKMADYFDVFRIDHILGFFRIWEIPWSSVEGTLGRFNPALPFSTDELKSRGIDFNYDRYCNPYIREYMVNDIFGEFAGEVRANYLDQIFPGAYNLKQKFNTQRKIKDHFDSKLADSISNQLAIIMNGLFKLAREVLFVEDSDSDGDTFNPNIDLYNTSSFKDLDTFQQEQLLELHRQYFFHRHNNFWRDRAMEKLPALKAATDMLVCGEDLGMVPDSVKGVMDDLQILSLAIQRMPDDNSKQFWHPADTSYLSVCSTSSHDTSTLRQWWEEDRARTQTFFNDILGNSGDAPFYCEPWVIDQIITQHLYSPSMWAIFPIQDLLAMDGDLRRVFPQDERINRPEIIPHYWRYRLHLNVEDLLKVDAFNEHVKQLVTESGRGN